MSACHIIKLVNFMPNFCCSQNIRTEKTNANAVLLSFLPAMR